VVKQGFVAFALLFEVAGCTSLSTAPRAPIGTTQTPPSGLSPELQSEVAEARDLDRLPPVTPHGHATIDHSGRKQAGHASFYADYLADKKMADGRRMNPNADTAASKTLPLGTVAEVTNLENGRSAKVQVEDRGPFIDGRVVDVSPKVAHQLGMIRRGVAAVVVKPIAVPQADGAVKLGAGAAGLSPEEMMAATSQSQALAGGVEPERASTQ
jgi:rare lipoprotein A